MNNHLASRAQQYYRRPTALGGGGGSFANLTAGSGMRLLTKTSGSAMSNGNGTYTIASSSVSKITIQGLGSETGNDGTNKVTVVMDVWADSARVNAASTN